MQQQLGLLCLLP